MPVQATRGAVYVARDPRDVAVSYAHHMARTVREAVEKLGRTGATDGSATSLQAQFPQVLGTWSGTAWTHR